jgi:hypothetical protein
MIKRLMVWLLSTMARIFGIEERVVLHIKNRHPPILDNVYVFGQVFVPHGVNALLRNVTITGGDYIYSQMIDAATKASVEYQLRNAMVGFGENDQEADE